MSTQYLTADHQHPGQFIRHGEMLIPRAIYESDPATYGLVPHITPDGPAPLGYSIWAFIDGDYYRELNGTEEERAQAILDQSRAIMQCTKLQAKRALAALGLAQAFLDFRANLALDPVANFEALAFVDDADIWIRTDPTFNAAADAMDKTEAEKDQFFTLAATL